MLARNSDLCRLATSSSARLVSSSPKRRALTMASPDWLANVRSSSGVSASKPPLDRFLITRAPTSRSRRTSGTASSERQPSSCSTSRCSSRGTVPEVGDLERGALRRRASDRRGGTRDAQVAQPGGQRLGAAGGRPHPEAVLGRVVLHDRAAVGAGEPYGAAHDLGEDLLEVQARADRVADLAQHLELGDLAGELLAAGAQRRDELDLAQDDRRLGRERADEVDLALVEGAGLGAPHRQDPDDVAVEEHRRRQQGSVAGEVLQVVPPVVRGRRGRPRSAGWSGPGPHVRAGCRGPRAWGAPPGGDGTPPGHGRRPGTAGTLRPRRGRAGRRPPGTSWRHAR